MNKLFFIPILIGAAVLVAGGCTPQRPSVPSKPETPSVSSTQTLKQEEASSTIAQTETRPECQRIEDEYTGPISFRNGRFLESIMRIEKYPISKKYKHLEKVGPVGLGEGGDSILARLFTAADCSDEQVERMMGADIGVNMPIGVYFTVNHPSKDFQSLLQNGRFERIENEKNDEYVPNDEATIKDVTELRFFAGMITQAGD